jgi:hypothetical protein
MSFLIKFFRGTKETVELRALPSKARVFTRESRKVMDFVRRHGGESVYFGCSTRKGGGDKEHCEETPALWADIDFKTIPEEEAWRLVQQFPIPPSVIIASGGGLHVYWLLTRPVPASDPGIEPILRGLARALRGDSSAAELARVMRLPGGLNWKYTPARPCRVLEADWARRYTLADFEMFRDESRGHANVNSDGAGKIREGHRNSFLMSLAGSLRHRGLDEATIAVALLAINHERCEPPLPESEVRNIAKNARKYAPGAGPEGSERLARLECYASIVPKPLRWLWRGRIPAGKVSLLVGDPDLGKSLITVDIAARIATGTPFPDGAPCELGSAITLSAEDDPEDTIRPRLDAAGANVSRVHCLRGVRVVLRDGTQTERGFSLEADIVALEDAVKRTPDVRLIVIDPISAYLGNTDSHNNAQVRGLLAPLADLAARTGVAILGVTHLRKSGGSAIHRIAESLAFSAAPRAVWVVAQDPDDERRRLMLRVKGNLSADPGGLAYRIEAADGIPHIVWEPGRVDLSPDEVIGGFESRDDRSGQQEAQKRILVAEMTQVLFGEVVRREKAGEPVMLKDRDAVPFLVHKGHRRSLARKVVNQPNAPWELKRLTDQRGHPVALIPRYEGENSGGNTTADGTPKTLSENDADFRRVHEQRAAERWPHDPQHPSGFDKGRISAEDLLSTPPENDDGEVVL